jgi:hypothetical protein
VRILLATAKGACATGGAQITSTEIDAAAGLEREAVDGGEVFGVDWASDGQERRKGEEAEDLGELHVGRLLLRFGWNDLESG